MRLFVAVIMLLVCVGCSTSADTDAGGVSDPNAVLLITKPDGQNDTTWDTDRGHLRVEDRCILFKGLLVAFPYGTKLTDGSTAVQISDDAEPIPLDGTADVSVTGSGVPVGREGDWDHSMDAANLGRWIECRRRADITKYANWWQIGNVELVAAD